MKIDSRNNRILFIASLIILLAASRGPWLRPYIHGFDATLAIFFAGGVYLRRYVYSLPFLLGAGLVDYLAVRSGVSSWCITPAYGFLVPTYLAVWCGGIKIDSLNFSKISRPGFLLTVLLVSGTAAFWISTASFHLLSGYYEPSQFWERFARSHNYYPKYVGSLFGYVFAFVGIATSIDKARLLFQKKNEGAVNLNP